MKQWTKGEKGKHLDWKCMKQPQIYTKKCHISHVVYSISPRAHYSLFESDTDGAYLPRKGGDENIHIRFYLYFLCQLI